MDRRTRWERARRGVGQVRRGARATASQITISVQKYSEPIVIAGASVDCETAVSLVAKSNQS